MFFAPAADSEKVTLELSSIATFQPRDVMLVQDYSGSMNDDTEFKSTDSLGIDAITTAITNMWKPGSTGIRIDAVYARLADCGRHSEDTGIRIPHVDVEYRGDEVHPPFDDGTTKVVLKDQKRQLRAMTT